MLSSLNALIVDNNKVNRKNLHSISRNLLGIKATEACESARDAVRIFQETEKLDIIFIDHETVNGETFNLLDEAKQKFQNKELKIILLASRASRDFLLEAASKGVSTFIVKPYNPKTIVEKVQKLYSSKAQRKSKRLSLLGAVPADIIHEDNKFDGALLDISSGGCLIQTPGFRRTGIEIFDTLTLRIPFEEEYVDLSAELIRLERNLTEESKMINAGFIFKEMHKDTALQFAKLWAALLRKAE